MGTIRISDSPFLKVILPAAAGIVLSRLVDIPVALSVICTVGMVACVWFFRSHTQVADIYLWCSVMLFFFTVAEVRTPRSSLPEGDRVVLAVQISESPFVSGRWQMTTAYAGHYRLEDDTLWNRISERVMLSVDTSFHDIVPGLQLALKGWFNPIDTVGGYGQLMKMRGLHGRIYLTPGNLLWRSPHVSHTPAYFAARMQSAAIERLDRLNLNPAEKGVVTAMTVGDKRGVDRVLRGVYSSTGAAHLLAVSGLHVGIVFILINILLYFLPIFRRGHVVRNIVAIVAIWLYAMAAGLAPSVVRAALMFSFAQLALATTSYRNAINIMLGSAVVMLAINPNYATDPSFLLSYCAVLSILLFFNPLYALVRTRFKVVNALLSVVIVGVSATVGTAPLVAYWFGNFPVAGMLINPVVIFTAHLIVMFGVLWIVMPLGFLEPLFSSVLSFAARMQNSVIEWSASLSWASIEVSLPLWGVLVAYAVYITVAIVIHNRKRKKSLSLPA